MRLIKNKSMLTPLNFFYPATGASSGTITPDGSTTNYSDDGQGNISISEYLDAISLTISESGIALDFGGREAANDVEWRRKA